MRKLFYLPLEPYKERYTCQLSAPITGWLESRWIQAGIDYSRVEGQSLNKDIKVGSVLDATGRGYWACSQIASLLRLINSGEVRSDDAIYFDDFWHPGISALPYAFHLMGIKPKMYAMLHAQSVDCFDFTYPMRHWMRHYEIGNGKVFDGIFVTSTCLRDLCLYAGIGEEHTVHVTGLPYNSEEVKGHFPARLPLKKKQVIFTSRWDKEKRPEFFLAVVRECLNRRQDITFLITTSAKELRSNSKWRLTLLADHLKTYPANLFLKENLTKEEYYLNLLRSFIQINTADQDFVSWTLLEATTCNCRPLYPYFLSFPEALEYNHRLMYSKGDVNDAVEKLIFQIDHFYTPSVLDRTYEWVYEKYDKSWKRMLNVMQGEEYEKLYRD